jgi:hypothetical protein
MYDTVGRRGEALARYRRVIAGDRDGDPATMARRHIRHAYHFIE